MVGDIIRGVRRVSVVVAGMLAGDPFQGGATWAALQYVLGLRQLGYEVVVVDPLPPGPIRFDVVTYFDAICSRFGLTGAAALVPADRPPHGMSAGELAGALRRTTVLVNLSGRWHQPEVLERIPVRAYVDLDPGFTQLWQVQGTGVGLAGHTHHLTVGAGVAAGSARVPAAGIEWRSILPPVVLHHWQVGASPSRPFLTTVANWRSYGSIEHAGTHYGQKAHAFRRLAHLPAASPIPICVALSIHPGDDVDR